MADILVNHTHKWTQITETPTTTSGYGITDAAAKTITVSAGTGLTGGGDLSSNRTISADFGTASGKTAQGDDARFNVLVDFSDRRYFRSDIQKASGFVPTSGTAYWTYCGRATAACTIKDVWATLSGNAAGTEVGELCVAYGDGPPGRGVNRTITKITAVASGTGLTSGAAKEFKGGSAQNASITAGMYVYLGCRYAYSVTQPGLQGLTRHNGMGDILTTAAAGVLTSGTSWTGTCLAFTAITGIEGPDLIGSLD